jgi:hypothetical protein
MAAEALPTTLLEDSIANWWRPLAVGVDGQIVTRTRDNERAVIGRGSEHFGVCEPRAAVSIAMQAYREALALRALGRG